MAFASSENLGKKENLLAPRGQEVDGLYACRRRT